MDTVRRIFFFLNKNCFVVLLSFLFSITYLVKGSDNAR